MNKQYKIIILIVALLLIISIGFFLYANSQNDNQSNDSETSSINQPIVTEGQSNNPAAVPRAPSDFTAIALSATRIDLTWRDNSNNELGFRIYREGVLIAELENNTSIYRDTNLKPGTSYIYQIGAFNSAGESQTVTNSFKTSNPSITVWIDKIGVQDNGEDFTRGEKGEVYLGLVISDNITTIENKIPETSHYSLAKNEVVTVNQKVFETGEVGDSLRIAVVGYEDDGGTGEQVIYSVLDLIISSYLWAPADIFLELLDLDFKTILEKLLGASDDWLGAYAGYWGSWDRWGVGKHVDIQCKKRDGNIGLRLWFTIESPDYN
ncbi:MAG: hypothetical protein A2Z29_03445 [Chloroflexi bacterium RBG_16_56_11]|nr:MAG: hypothetical protein A2Z29_03445 [Chloroflexi bacterium RBG_16_56_11]